MKLWTHKDLVARAERWLRNTRGCKIALTEYPFYTGETPDAIGWLRRGRSILVECKTSRDDFHADANKSFRLYQHQGVGAERYYMAVKGLLKPEDLPADWGLLEVHGNAVIPTVQARPRKDLRSIHAINYEMRALISALTRVQLRLQRASLDTWLKATHMLKSPAEMAELAAAEDKQAFQFIEEGWQLVVNPNDLPTDPGSEELWCPQHEVPFAECVCIGPFELGTSYVYIRDQLYGRKVA